jgi:hypothetical protein
MSFTPQPYRFLTIVRDEANRGDEIAQTLAQCLGWRLLIKKKQTAWQTTTMRARIRSASRTKNPGVDL